MKNQLNANQFRKDEIVIMSHWDKKNEEWVRTAWTMTTKGKRQYA